MRISDWSSDVCSSDPGDRSDPYPARQNNGLTNRIISAAFDHAPGVRIGSAPERDFGGHMRRQAKTAGGIEKVIRRVEPGFQRERGYPIGLPLPLGAGEIIIVFARSDQFKAIGIGEPLLPDRGGNIGDTPGYDSEEGRAGKEGGSTGS